MRDFFSMKEKVTAKEIIKVATNGFSKQPDLLVVEEPLEIRLGYGLENNRRQKSLAVTMRTPGNDEELAVGFLYSENIIVHKGDVLSVKPCVDKKTGKLQDNIIRVELHPSLKVDIEKLSRNFYTTSSCGVCGKTSLELVEQSCSIEIPNSFKVSVEMIKSLPEKLNSDQLIFGRTGGLHATAIFSKTGNLEWVREDVGRHNAFDKIIGYLLLKEELPLFNKVALVSGRTSFELLQKAAMAGVPILCAIGAPSSLAVQLAEDFNITLIGFLSHKRFNIYTHPERIIL